jgi:hypothetical protein
MIALVSRLADRGAVGVGIAEALGGAANQLLRRSPRRA